MEKLDLYHIDMKYIRNLSKVSDRVFSVSPQTGKEARPFLGIITIVDGREYCIPLTSPKEKHRKMKSAIDMIKIFDENERDENHQFKLIGILNLNNMIPVNREVVKRIDLTLYDSDYDDVTKYKLFMNKQLSWCRENAELIKRRALRVYELITKKPDENHLLAKRSLPFSDLEKALEKYTKAQSKKVAQTLSSSTSTPKQRNRDQDQKSTQEQIHNRARL